VFFSVGKRRSGIADWLGDRQARIGVASIGVVRRIDRARFPHSSPMARLILTPAVLTPESGTALHEPPAEAMPGLDYW
jgi:hypothetical protein